MSVINQVLNQLEKRGAHITDDLVMVRSVPPGREMNNNKLLLSALGLVVTGALLWQWLQTGDQGVAVPSHVQDINKAVAKSAAPTPSPVPMPSFEPTPNVAATNTAVTLSPDLQMSFELSLIELSYPLHQDEILLQPAAAKSKSLRGHTSSTAGAPKVNNVEPESASDTPMKKISKEQQADGEFRKAVALMQQGHIAEAQAGYDAALRLDAGHDAARQALVALLLENKRSADAERVLQERLNSKPDQTGFAMMLARLQVERGAVTEATATLENALPYANSQANYQAFLAALLQRQNRNGEAIMHYQLALQIDPDNGIWLMGYGISLQSAHRNVDAKVAFQRALDTQTLSPDLQAFVQQQIKSF